MIDAIVSAKKRVDSVRSIIYDDEPETPKAPLDDNF